MRLIMIGRERGVNLIDSVIEYPLKEWADVPGSKVRLIDIFRVGTELFRLACYMNIPAMRERYHNSLLERV